MLYVNGGALEFIKRETDSAKFQNRGTDCCRRASTGRPKGRSVGAGLNFFDQRRDGAHDDWIGAEEPHWEGAGATRLG